MFLGAGGFCLGSVRTGSGFGLTGDFEAPVPAGQRGLRRRHAGFEVDVSHPAVDEVAPNRSKQRAGNHGPEPEPALFGGCSPKGAVPVPLHEGARLPNRLCNDGQCALHKHVHEPTPASGHVIICHKHIFSAFKLLQTMMKQ